jgi:hypothetical protein
MGPVVTYQSLVKSQYNLYDQVRPVRGGDPAVSYPWIYTTGGLPPRLIPQGNGMMEEKAEIEVPTIYLRAEFNKAYGCDAKNQITTTLTPSWNNGDPRPYPFIPSSGFGGVILSNSAGTKAMGLYGVWAGNSSASQRGSVTYFSVTNFDNPSSTSTSASADDCMKMTAVYSSLNRATSNDLVVAAGDRVFTTWIMTGTLADVKTYMYRLYADGVIGAVQTAFSADTIY